MFDLEQAIADWRDDMFAAGITPSALEELEGHLHEEFKRQVKLQSNAAMAFEVANSAVGAARPLGKEFKKVGLENLNLPLAWLAWGTFVVSFCLPACAGIYGWGCAWMCIGSFTWQDVRLGQWNDLLFMSLNFANLWMLASPLLFLRFMGNARRQLGLRLGNFMALALTWSYITIGLFQGGANSLQIGCYLWLLSFLLLNLSLYVRQQPKLRYV